ncbi:MAG TPA: Asp-tRNA(Asn)/Glu-tRNA(Gln) amidotransferase subunit GatA [Thermoanaerobaculia bacterium]|nr:Asp-tRNA(Asn)/Glu-tRNA(Gln) amidotransferase subunit GatA [Thermoanaerobaculia bacterium]
MSPIGEIVSAIRDRSTTAERIAGDALDRIARIEPRIGAFLTWDEERVLAEARRVDQRIAAGEDLPLAGVLVGIKDNMTAEGYPASCASRILEGFTPGYDATAVARLKTAGAIVAGKTNLDEFAMGSSTENSAFQKTRNPWDPERVPGGSSGGSAASVAAREVPAALGSDTGGSVRQPAALCGVVGLKPTYGRVSRFGLVAFASSLDQIGPIAATVEDCVRIYAAIAGPDPRDSTAAPDVPAGDPLAALGRGAKGLRVGVLREAAVEGADPQALENFAQAVSALERAGAVVEEVSVPRAPFAIPVYYVVANAEASSNLARYDGIRYGPRDEAADLASFYADHRTRGFGAEVKRRILLGTFALSAGYADAFYGRASRVRALLKRDFAAAFSRVDAIACPTVPGPAFRLGEKVDDPLAMYLSDIYTTPASLAGIPAISVPSGFSREGLPLALQLMAPPWREETLFALAAAYERETRFTDAVPPIAG